MNRYKWMKLDQRKPVRWIPPENYIILEQIFKDFKLVNINLNILKDYKKLTKTLGRKMYYEPNQNFAYKRTKEIWDMEACGLLSNEQKDLAWCIIREILPTKNFQHCRGLIRNAQCECVKMGCYADETPLHIFLNSGYAQED